MIVSTTKHGEEVMKDLYRRMMKSGQYDFAIDTETQPKHPYTGKKDALIIGRMEIIIFSICYRGISYSFPTDRFLSGYPSMEEWADVLRPYVEDRGIRKVMHNANYDLSTFMTSTTLDKWNNVHCTMIGAWLAREYVEKSLKERAPFYGRYIQKTAGIEFTDLEDLSTYAEMDVVVTDELYQMQAYGRIRRPCVIEHVDAKGQIVKTRSEFTESLLDGKKSRDVLSIIDGEELSPLKKAIMSLQEIPAMRCNVRAELLGFPVNRYALFAARKKLLRSLNDALKSVYRTAGRKFNLRSTKQLAEVMTELGVDSPVKSKKTGAPSYSAQALVKLAGSHSIIDQIKNYKDLDKMMSVYIGDGDKKHGLLEYVDPYDKIHCTINSIGAVTGRGAASLPNLMQLPSRKDTFGIKDCFVSTNSIQSIARSRLMKMVPEEALSILKKLPEEKRQVILCLDYAQLEIRVMALLCKDPRMTEVLCDPEGDIHQTTADHFGVPRNPAAKNLNFLLLYGGQEYMLSEALSFMGVPTTKDQAASYIKRHKETYPNVVAYRKWLLDAYKQDGFVEYFTGRTRTLEYKVDWNNRYQVHKAETTLSNNICQGCISGSQRLLTKDGLLPIVEVMRRHVDEKKNQKIWSGNKWEDVTDVFSVGKKPLYEVELSDGSVFETSDTHLWKNELGEWVKTSALRDGDFVQQSVSLTVGAKGSKLLFTEDHAEFVGMCLGDGAYSLSDMRLVRKKDKDIARRQESLLNKVFGEKGWTNQCATSRKPRFYIRQEHRNLFRDKLDLGFRKHLEKEVPPWLFTSPVSFRQAFVRGYYLTDGGTSNRLVMFTSVSKKLVQGVQKILYSLGLASVLKSFPAAKQNQSDYHRLYLAPQSKAQFCSLFDGFKSAKVRRLRVVCTEPLTNKGEYLPPRLAQKVAEDWESTFESISSYSAEYKRRKAMHAKLTRGKGSLPFARQLPLSEKNKELVSKSYLKVVRVTDMKQKVEMFDLTVEPSHQYAAWNGTIMHNSGQDFLKAAINRADYRGILPDALPLKKYRHLYPGREEHFDMINEEVLPEVKRIRSLFKQHGCHYLLQVHDEVIFTVDVRGAEECLEALGSLMCLPHYLPGTTDYTVPLAAEGGIGLTWKQAKGGDAFKTVEARMEDKYLSSL